MRRAVVLAAGAGSRLGRRTLSVPKPLVPVAGLPLIQHTLRSLHEAGVAEAVVVTGYRAEQLRAALEGEGTPPLPLTFVFNPLFRRGASYSLRAARPVVAAEPFLLVMSDHLLSTALLERLIAAAQEAPAGRSLVAIDRSTAHTHAYLEEATRVQTTADGLVEAIGKGLPGATAMDCGAFACDPRLWSAVDAAAEDCDLSTIFSVAAARRELGVADVTGTWWYDIDTEDDLAEAERRLALDVPGARP